MAPQFTRVVTCDLGDRSRMQFLTRDCKRVARLYGGVFGSQVDPLSAFHAEYRVAFPTRRMLEVVSALRRRKGRR